MLQKHNMINIKRPLKAFLAIFLPNLYIIYICISYFILRLFLLVIEIYLFYLKFLDYTGGSLGEILTFTLFIRFYYISDDG